MTTIAYSSVNIQTSVQSVPSIPDWFGEITLMAHHLQQQGVLAAIEEQVHFARRRFGLYEVIDFVALLFGYAISGERTLETFYECLQPWADPFMALFGRDRLPARATLSRFLAALDQTAPQRRLRPLCAPGYTGRKRGEVVRSRTTILQAHTHQFLGTFGNPGNGEYRAELRRAVTAIQSAPRDPSPP